MKILLAEDDTYLSDIYYTAFTKRGYSVDIAKNGIEAVNMEHAGDYDLILLDIMLPMKTGLEVSREVQTPVIFLTALDSEYIAAAYGLENVKHYLRKEAFLPKELIAKVEEVMGWTE